MSNKRRDYAGSLYDQFRNNPARDRKGLLEHMYMRMISEMACARFKWEGLPDSIDLRYLELELFHRALVVFYYDRDFDKYLALRGSGAAGPNMYDNPIAFKVIGNTQVSKTLKAKDCVPIWANTLRIPDWDIVLLYSTKLAELELTIEHDVQAMRHPFVVAVNDNEKLSFMNAMRQVREGQPVIFGTEGLADAMDQKIKVFDMKIDKDEILNLQLAKQKLWNECMTLLGINNANQDKRERLVTSEVSANNSQVLLARNIGLDARRKAAKEINEMYPNLPEVTVSWNVDEENLADEKGLSESALLEQQS